jgi:hypothetical protein
LMWVSCWPYKKDSSTRLRKMTRAEENAGSNF